MKVYIVEVGVYAERGIAGVYPSSDAAMRAYPREAWRNVGEDEWNNVRNTGDALSITGYPVER
jgi:hypothetical protein